MEPQVIYRRWRPRTLSEIVGQETVTTTLRNAVRTGRVGHAYLFSGPRGTGKTSTGRILAKAVNCENPVDGEPCGACASCLSIARGETLDIIEIDAASNRGVDDIRALRERVGYAAASLKRKVYIIDEVHMLTDVASNALLKTLEEPPPHVMFVLATTELHKVLPTIVSRCQCFAFHRLAFGAIVSKLRRVCESEGIEAGDETLSLIARAAGGSLRDAENLLQQLIASHGTTLLPADVRAELGVVEDASVLRLTECVISRDLPGALRLLHEAIEAGVDVRHLGRQIVESLHDMVLLKSGCRELVEAGPEHVETMQRLADNTRMEDLARAMKQFSLALAGDASRQLLALELALVDWSVFSHAGGAVPDAGEEMPRPHRPTGRSASRSQAGLAAPRRSATASPAPAELAVPHDHAAVRGVAESVATAEAQPTPQPAAVVPAPGIGEGLADRPSPAAASSPIPASADMSPTSEPPSAAAETVPASELDRVRSRWKEYVASLRGSTGNLDALLRSACEPASLTDGVLVLRFAYELHRGKVEEPKCRQVVEEQLQRFYGQPYRISCVLAGQPEPKSAPAAAPTSVLVDALVAQGGQLKGPESPAAREGGDDAQ